MAEHFNVSAGLRGAGSLASTVTEPVVIRGAIRDHSFFVAATSYLAVMTKALLAKKASLAAAKETFLALQQEAEQRALQQTAEWARAMECQQSAPHTPDRHRR